MTPQDASRWSQAEILNQKELLTYFGSSPLAAGFITDELGWVMTGVPSNDYNGVLWTHLPTNEAEQRIEAVVNYFDQHQLPFTWYLNETDKPLDLVERLQMAGCYPLAPGVAMGLNLNELPTVCPPSILRIQPVETAQALSIWMQVWAQTNDSSSLLRESLHASLLHRSPTQLIHFLAWTDDQPIGISLLFLGSETAGLYSVAVQPAYQRRGIGTALCLTTLQAAKQRGYNRAVTGPTSESLVMYQRMGFRLFTSTLNAYHRWPDSLR